MCSPDDSTIFELVDGDEAYLEHFQLPTPFECDLTPNPACNAVYHPRSLTQTQTIAVQWRRRLHDQCRDIGLYLIGREHRREHMADQQCPEQDRREGFDRPVEDERRAKTSRMPRDFRHGGKKSFFGRTEMIMSQISRFTFAIQRPKPLQRTSPSNGPG